MSREGMSEWPPEGLDVESVDKEIDEKTKGPDLERQRDIEMTGFEPIDLPDEIPPVSQEEQEMAEKAGIPTHEGDLDDRYLESHEEGSQNDGYDDEQAEKDFLSKKDE